jgi:protein tyrosine/serine phosphatase
MNYFNFFKSSFNILYDRGSDFVNYYLISSSDENRPIRGGFKKRVFSALPKIDQYHTFFSGPTHIIDNIYLGSAYNASNYDSMEQINIGFIINMTSEISNYHCDQIIYKKYPIYDNNSESIKPYLEKIYDQIISYQELNNNKNIFIHCFMGASRSATVVAYYLMRKHKYTVDDAITFMKQKRNVVNPTMLFYEELHEIEKMLN